MTGHIHIGECGLTESSSASYVCFRIAVNPCYLLYTTAFAWRVTVSRMDIALLPRGSVLVHRTWKYTDGFSLRLRFCIRSIHVAQNQFGGLLIGIRFCEWKLMRFRKRLWRYFIYRIPSFAVDILGAKNVVARIRSNSGVLYVKFICKLLFCKILWHKCDTEELRFWVSVFR